MSASHFFSGLTLIAKVSGGGHAAFAERFLAGLVGPAMNCGDNRLMENSLDLMEAGFM